MNPETSALPARSDLIISIREPIEPRSLRSQTPEIPAEPLTAHDRLDLLVDSDSFEEFGSLARNR